MPKNLTILALACAVALPSMAVAQDKPAKTAAKNDPDKKICRTIKKTGSRLASERQCRTQAEWDAELQQNGDALRGGMLTSPR